VLLFQIMAFSILCHYLLDLDDPKSLKVCRQSNLQKYVDETYAKLHLQQVHCDIKFRLQEYTSNFIIYFFICPKYKSFYLSAQITIMNDYLDSMQVHNLQQYVQQVFQQVISLSLDQFIHLLRKPQTNYYYQDNIELC